jgi:hypothetical protein
MDNRCALALCAVLVLLSLAGCSKEKDPEETEFDKRFRREAVLVKTCSGDPAVASGPTAGVTKVYRFQQELWFDDRGVMRRVDAKPENVCDILRVSK